MNMSLKSQAARGVKWQVAVSVIQKIITFATTIVLARQLGPEVYGLFAFALVVVSSFELFKSMGIDSALLRREDDFDRAADTAFVIIPALGIVLFGLLYVTAPLIGSALDNRQMVEVVRVLGIIFVITCFTKVPVILMERQLLFKGVSIAEIISAAVFSATALILVSLRAGIWTLVGAYIMRNLAYMLITWLWSGWKPGFTFDARLALDMFNFGKFVFLAAAAWFLKANLDNIFVGKLLGVTMLGYYAVAFNIGNFGFDYLGGRINRVIYPLYARLQSDKDKLTAAFLRVLTYICLAAFPLSVGAFLLGGDFIRITYGEKWVEAVPVLKVLSWLGIGNLVPVATESVFLTLGKPSYTLKTVVLQVALFFLLVPFAAPRFGLAGVASVVTGASLVAMALQLVWVKKLLNIRYSRIFACIRPAIGASVVMAAAVLICKRGWRLIPGVPYGNYSFLIELFVAVAIYMSVLMLTNRVLVKEVRTLLAE